MTIKSSFTLAIIFISFIMGGCVSKPQLPVSLAQEALSTKTEKIGVAMAALPKVDTQFPGADCLLCIAAASIANSSLTTYTQTLTHEDLPQLKNQVADKLRKRGFDVVLVDEELKLDALPDISSEVPNTARKDFSALKKKHNLDKILVINISSLGIWRNYSAYIPNGDPKAVVKGQGYLVNLKSNTYDWYQPVDVAKSAGGKWDEEPKFPGLTNAYFQAIELGKDVFLKTF